MALVIPDFAQGELELFTSLKGIKVVFDVGARTDVEYVKIKPKIEFHAFEPNPEFFKELEAQLKDRPNTYLNNFGLGDEEVVLKYNDKSQAFIGGDHHRVNHGDQELPISTLNKYCRDKGIQHIDFLKIDTEGYDYKVLLGGSEVFRNCRYIQYEHWDDKLKFHDLLENDFIMSYIGGRNVFCQRKW